METVVAVLVRVVENAPLVTRVDPDANVTVAMVGVRAIPFTLVDNVSVGMVTVPVNVGLSSWARVCVPAGSVETVVAVEVSVVENAPFVTKVDPDA